MSISPSLKSSRSARGQAFDLMALTALCSTVIRWLAALTICQACMILPSYGGDTNAVIPYKTLDDLCQVADGVDRTKLVISVFVSSKNKAVNPGDIRLAIQSAAKGTIPVLVGTNGQILKFPHEKELRRENPSIIANQPKGTLGLAIKVQLPMPDGLTFRYRRIGDGVAEINKAIRAQAGMLSLLAPKAQGVIFVFPKSSAGKAKIKIGPVAGTREHSADENGQIKIKLEKTLLAENPEVKFSEKPALIIPDIQ